jgi:HAD superfamily hydrolase (TIGR01509 family)
MPDSDILFNGAMNYNTLIFDAFDTVVHINRDKLPSCQIDGNNVRTTSQAVHETYCSHFGRVDFDAFYRAFSQSFEEVSAVRRTEWKEIRSQERMRVMLRVLGHAAADVPEQILDSLTRAHMAQLAESFEVRPETINVLEWAKARFRIAMISNFDYAPALYDALDRFGIRSAFEKVVVSDEVGWRKPHRIIFDRALEQLGITSEQALFIGDQLYVDVYGAVNSGMDVVWIETERQDWLTPGLPEPTYKVRSIAQIIEILGEES